MTIEQFLRHSLEFGFAPDAELKIALPMLECDVEDFRYDPVKEIVTLIPESPFKPTENQHVPKPA